MEGGGVAILSINLILNKIPYKNKDKGHYELWTSHKLSYKYLKVWRYLVKIELRKPKQIKIGLKAINYSFIRYVNNNSAYQFLVQKSIIPDIYEGTTIE